MRRQSWMLTFADMLSILLCFLVLAYALKAAPEGVQGKALSAIREVFRPGDKGQSGGRLELGAPRGGNYWATWLKVRMGKIPALADLRIAAHGATASIALSESTDALSEADAEALAAILNNGGVAVVVRAKAQSDTPADWLEAGRRAQALSNRLVAAGLRQTPGIVVSGAGPSLAVEIGREES